VIIHGKETDEEQRSALDSDKYYHRTRKKKMEQKRHGISEVSEVGRESYILNVPFPDQQLTHDIAL
jgi:hypothetical protein